MPPKRPVTNDDLARMIKQGFDQTATKADVAALRAQLDTQGRVLVGDVGMSEISSKV